MVIMVGLREEGGLACRSLRVTNKLSMSTASKTLRINTHDRFLESERITLKYIARKFHGNSSLLE
jgi:hypothetical protein